MNTKSHGKQMFIRFYYQSKWRRVLIMCDPLYEMFRSLVSRRSPIGYRKQGFQNRQLMKNEHMPDDPWLTRHLLYTH